MIHGTWQRHKIIVGCLLAVIFIGLIYAIFSQNASRLSLAERTRQKTFLYQGATVELFQKKTVEQTFMSNYPGLSGIEVLFMGNSAPVRVNFHLKLGCNRAEDIIYLPNRLLPAGDGNLFFYSFNFSPLDDSTGQTYCLVLESPDSTSDTSLKLPLSSGDLYPLGQTKIYDPDANKALSHKINNNPISNVTSLKQMPFRVFLPLLFNQPSGAITGAEDTGFILHYNGQILPSLSVFVQRLIAHKPFIWGQPWFYGSLLIIYILLLVGLFFLVLHMAHSKSLPNH